MAANPGPFVSRELDAAPPRPSGEPLLRVDTAVQGGPIAQLFHCGTSMLQSLAQFARSERRHAGRGSIEFFAESIHIRRDPVRHLGERGTQVFDLCYRDVTRVEFVRPETVTLGFGPIATDLNQQVALAVDSLVAEDAFDNIVDRLERHGTRHLYSVLDDGKLAHSRPWTWEERYPEWGHSDEVATKLLQLRPTARWLLTVGDPDAPSHSFHVTVDHGLVLTAAEAPGQILMQAFASQLLDGTGFALSTIARGGGQVGIVTSHDEVLTLDAEDDLWLGKEMVGSLPNARRIDMEMQERMSPVLGGMPDIASVVPDPVRRLKVRRPLPLAWLIAMAMVALLEGYGRASGTRR